MGELKKLEFFVLRYTPHAVKQEFINMGVVGMESAGGDAVFAKARFTTDWKRLLCLFPDAQIDVVKSFCEEIETQLGEPRDRESLLKWLRDSSSGTIQMSEIKGCETEDPEAELEILNQIYLKTVPSDRPPLIIPGREGIRTYMARAFESAGVLGLMWKNIPVAPYTKPGDPFTFDFGYRFGDEIKFFQGLSLKRNVQAGILLAARYPKIALGITRETRARAELTAVIDDDLDRGPDEVRFALGALEEEGIRIAVAAEMPSIAERARVDLKA
jgi:Protein of unknown function (DUF3037)